jgi:hypothetical protein
MDISNIASFLSKDPWVDSLSKVFGIIAPLAPFVFCLIKKLVKQLENFKGNAGKHKRINPRDRADGKSHGRNLRWHLRWPLRWHERNGRNSNLFNKNVAYQGTPPSLVDILNKRDVAFKSMLLTLNKWKEEEDLSVRRQWQDNHSRRNTSTLIRRAA